MVTSHNHFSKKRFVTSPFSLKQPNEIAVERSRDAKPWLIPEMLTVLLYCWFYCSQMFLYLVSISRNLFIYLEDLRGLPFILSESGQLTKNINPVCFNPGEVLLWKRVRQRYPSCVLKSCIFKIPMSAMQITFELELLKHSVALFTKNYWHCTLKKM